MAERLAFNPISVRAQSSSSQSPLRNYRPAFESIVLGRPIDGLDPSMVSSLGTIINAAYKKGDEKGVGGKVREIFADFAAKIDNNIVKLASQRIGEVINGVGAEHLPQFLSAMHQEMLKNPDRADAIPEAMLNTYNMSGGRLGAGAIVRAVRIGFAKSRTLCPKEVSHAVRSEYENGGLDHISEVSAIRNEPVPSGRIEIIYALSGGASANDNMPLPEAVPIVHFTQPKMPEELNSGISYLQEVPQIVASKQREEVRKRRKDAKMADFRAAQKKGALSDIEKPEAAETLAGPKKVRELVVLRIEKPKTGDVTKTTKAETIKAPRKEKIEAQIPKPDLPPKTSLAKKTGDKTESRSVREPEIPKIKSSMSGEPRQSAGRLHPKSSERRRLPRVPVRAITELKIRAVKKETMIRRTGLAPIVNLLRRAVQSPKKKEPAADKKKAARMPVADAPRRGGRPAPGAKARKNAKPAKEKRAPKEAKGKPKVKNAPRLKEQVCTYRIRKSKGNPQKEKPAEAPRVARVQRIREKNRRRAPGEIVFKLGF